MNLRVLRYFLAVAREGSITGAAATLHVTQPTLSRQLQDLEAELGTQLLIRSNHHVSLTTEGMILKNRATEIIDLVSKTKAEFSSLQYTIGGDIYIGGGETRAMSLIAQVIETVHTDYPAIHFHLYSGNAEDVTERLNKGLLDFGILIQATDISKYDYLHLPAKDSWGLVMPKLHPLAQRQTITRQDLLTIPLICSRQALQQTSEYNEFIAWFGEDFAKLNIIATYNLLFNAALLVEQGIGCALTLDKLLTLQNNSNLCFRPLWPTLEASLDIVWKKYQIFSPAAKVFLTALQQQLLVANSD